MHNQDTNNESITLEDLRAQNADEVKGGPNPKVKRTIVLQSSATGEPSNNIWIGEPLSIEHGGTGA